MVNNLNIHSFNKGNNEESVSIGGKVKMKEKFRRKPVILEAEQFNGKDLIPPMFITVDASGIKVFWIKTLEGALRVRKGDWIVTGIKGECYPVKDDIFWTIYEKAGDCDYEKNTGKVR